MEKTSSHNKITESLLRFFIYIFLFFSLFFRKEDPMQDPLGVNWWVLPDMCLFPGIG